MNKFNIVGNNHIISQVNSWTITKNYPNAILISGAQGSGRHTLAKSIAKAIVCSGDNPPCLKCINCKKAELGIHPDIEIITGAKGLKSFHIDAIRDMRSRAFTKPNEAAKRVIILENAHNMTEAAQNALLKILEEPPSYLHFILTCDDNSGMLITILSRCVCLHMSPVSDKDGIEVIKSVLYNNKNSKNIIPNDEILFETLHHAGGIIGRALELLSKKSTLSFDLAEQMANAIILNDELSLVRICGAFEKDKELMRQTLSQLSLICRDALAIRENSNILLSGQKDIAINLSKAVDRIKLINIIYCINELISCIDKYINNTLLLALIPSKLMEC